MGEFEHKPFDGIGADTNIPTDSEREFSAKIADVDIRDDFMFSYVMCNRQICTELLQYCCPTARSAASNTMNWARMEPSSPRARLRRANR